MCRLLGVTNFDYAAHQDIVAGFCGLARTGKVMAGDPPGHGDGWGLAFYEKGQLVVDKSGGNLIDEAGRVHDQLRRVGESPVVILHLRKSAWSDSTSTRHAHPFQHGNVAFVHNGVVYDYKEFLPEITVPGLEPDALDTEVFFYHFMSARSRRSLVDGQIASPLTAVAAQASPPLRRGDRGDLPLGSDLLALPAALPLPDPPPPGEGTSHRGLGAAFLETVGKIKREGLRFSALNCLFSDGAALYAYRDYSKEPDYYSLFKAFTGNSGIISSEPLSADLHWGMMAKEEFLKLSA